MSDIPVLDFDAIIIGGGGSGMRAGLQLAESGSRTAVISKVFPTRSHTVSAQGGITCAIASEDPNDDWRWHMYDTIKGSDYLRPHLMGALANPLRFIYQIGCILVTIAYLLWGINIIWGS